MSGNLEFQVEEVFGVGDKTIFAGELKAGDETILRTDCRIVVDGQTVGSLLIEGEVSGTGHRDLWTKQVTSVSRELAKRHSVVLMAP